MSSLLHFNILNYSNTNAFSTPDVKITEFLYLQSFKKLAMNDALDDEVRNIFNFIYLIDYKLLYRSNTKQTTEQCKHYSEKFF